MSRKYKLTGICLFAIITILSISTFTASAATQVTLQPLSGVVESGNTVTVDIFVDPDTEIAGMQFDLKFNESLLQVTNVTEGDLFKQSGTETLFSPGQKNTGILKNVYGCILGKEEVSTSGTFATVTLSLTSDKNITSEMYLENVIVSSPVGKAVEIEVKNNSTEPVETKDESSLWREMIYKLLKQLM